MTARLELTGQTFHRWTVLGLGSLRKGHTSWRCRCTCGTERLVEGTSLRSGASKSCGCLKREVTLSRIRIHGLSHTPEWHAWHNMTRRCYNPRARNYHLWGGRGISVCQAWRESFETFLRDLGPRPTPQHTLDRWPNPDGNYEPDNVRWATPKEQASNRRMPDPTSYPRSRKRAP